jgi:uncharacterized protein (DUF433 family)
MTMSTAEATIQTEYRHIVRTPAVVGGEPRIAGHRIRVRDIVAARDLGGHTPEEIATGAYPPLTLAQVYAALAYYEDHRAEIGRAADNEAGIIAQFIQHYSGLVGKVGVTDGES